jgi:hypothetical protein
MSRTHPDRVDPPELVSHQWTKTFTQEGDCCGDGTQALNVAQDDGGGGPFWIIDTERWAINSISELVAVLQAAGVPMVAAPNVTPTSPTVEVSTP